MMSLGQWVVASMTLLATRLQVELPPPPPTFAPVYSESDSSDDEGTESGSSGDATESIPSATTPDDDATT